MNTTYLKSLLQVWIESSSWGDEEVTR